MTSRTGRGAGAGFTLLELLVVMTVIAILSTMVISLMGTARRNALKRAAAKEIKDLEGALTIYYRYHNTYPPDTGNWNGGVEALDEDGNLILDEWSLHRYLGRDLYDRRRRKKFTAVIHMNPKRLCSDKADPDHPDVRTYSDPWGQPYHLDAVHIRRVVNADGLVYWQRVGEPYYGTEVEEVRTLDYRIVSSGPDMATGANPFDPTAAEADKVKDDIRSW